MKKISLLTALAAFASTLVFAQNSATDPVMPEKIKEAIAKACPSKAAASPKKARKILSFSRTTGWRHNTGIMGANEFLKNVSKNLGVFEIVYSEDPAEFDGDNLKKYDAVILNNATSTYLTPLKDPKNPKASDWNDEAKAVSNKRCQNLIDYVNNGGGVFAIHAGVDCYNYPHNRNKAYTDMLGGEFISHPWGAGNPAETFVVDDPNSPITKGIWKNEAFKLQDEIYMVGNSFDRNKCRVLIRIDEFRSPLSNFGDGTYPPKKKNVRTDGDVAMVWIKSFGKGRVAYGAYGHGWENYQRPEIQELYLRIAQFVCGDLKADTSSIALPNKSVYVPMYEQPTIESIKELSNLQYGEKDLEINTLLYAAYSNNTDAEFCKKMENFVYNELNSDSGSGVYRATLAELLRAVEISSDASCAKFQKILDRLSKAKDYDTRGICGRLSNAIDHWRTKTVVFDTKKDKDYVVPTSLPQGWRAQSILIRYLAVHPEVKIPDYLKFSALDEAGKAMLAYAIYQRGEDTSEAMKIKPQSMNMLVAKAFLVAKKGTSADLDSILECADLLNSNEDFKVVSAFLASIKSKDLVGKLIEKSTGKVTAKQGNLLSQTMGRLDISNEMSAIYAKYPSMDSAQKASMLGLMEAVATKDIFINLLKIYQNSATHPEFGKEMKVISRCAANVKFDEEMLDAVIAAGLTAKEPKEIAMFLRFMPMSSSPKALDFCTKQYKVAKDPVIKTLGDWKNALALEPLVKIAKSVGDTRSKTLVQISIVNVGKRSGFDAATAKYMLDNAIRAEEKELAIEIMVKKPSPQIVELLKKKGLNKDAEKAAEILKNLKPTFDCSFDFNAAEKAKAVNGNRKDYWCTNAFFPKDSWIAVDFSYPKSVSKIVFHLGKIHDFPRDYQLYAGATVQTAAPVNSKLDISSDGWTATITLDKPVLATVFKVVSTKDCRRHWTISDVVAE